jgi:hypothetical protein
VWVCERKLEYDVGIGVLICFNTPSMTPTTTLHRGREVVTTTHSIPHRTN